MNYIGSIVLGMSDALVELTGALAGLTFALQDTRLIAVVAIITGVAAALSMANSEYFSRKAEHTKRNPFKAACYTGAVYFITVILLVFPFFFFSSAFLSLIFTIATALLIIALLTYYLSRTQHISFKNRFLQMSIASLSIAAFSFLIGYLVRIFFGI